MKRAAALAFGLAVAASCAVLIAGCSSGHRLPWQEAIIGSSRGAFAFGSSSPEGALILHQEDAVRGAPVTHFIAIELESDTRVRYEDGSERRWSDLNIGSEVSERRPEFMESNEANTRVVFVRRPTGFHARRIEYVDPSTEPSAAATWLDRGWMEVLPGGVYRAKALQAGGSDPPGQVLSFRPDGTAEFVPAGNDFYHLDFETLMSREHGAWVWHGFSLRASQALLSRVLSAELSDGSVDLFDLTDDRLLQVDFTMKAGEPELVDLKVLGEYDRELSPGLLP